MQNEKNDGCDDNGLNATLDNVLIENNHIERCDKCGIVVRGCKRNLNISHNYMENIGGDGILASGCYKGMIEHNVAKRTCMRSGYMDLKGSTYRRFIDHTIISTKKINIYCPIIDIKNIIM